MRNGHQYGGQSFMMTASAGAAAGTECVAAVSFEEEVRPHLQALHRSARRMTRDDEVAEDLVQDTLERAYRKFDLYEPGTNVRAWLLRMMRNLWISSCRRQVGAPHMASLDEVEELSLHRRVAGDDPSSSEVEARVIDRLGEASILAAIATLPAHFREAVVLADVEGTTYLAIAEALEVPLGTITSRLFRGRRRLRRVLREQAGGAGYLAKAG
jgi:RNA polymerase sigma-70 factor, ECF subfamily